ncbi:MAG: DUF1501 domain-containing protein [Bryobacterales bacterium]
MTTTRRFWLKSSGLALAGFTAAPSFLCRAAALESKRNRILVALFQRGAVDGLNMVAPYFEDRYHELRPNLALARPGKGDAAALDLDGRFGLHPALEPLLPHWQDKSLAIVHAVGSPDATRSHFDAQDYMESGVPGDKGVRDGWLNRYLVAQPQPEPSPLRAVSVSPATARSLSGSAPAPAIERVRDFSLGGGRPQVSKAFEALYGMEESKRPIESELQEASHTTFEALRLVEQVRAKPYRPANGASYPRGRTGQRLEQIAQLIKADVGLEIAFADSGGWDTHTNQDIQLNNLLGEMGQALHAFSLDLGSRMADVLVLTMSEFGRTARENGARGTDHGHANAMFALGGGVQGGKVYGDWPGLSDEELYQGRDLALTTDFRDVFSEALERHLGLGGSGAVFPGYKSGVRRGFLEA